jgi:competence protein ComEC
VDYLVLSHPHPDHMNGLPYIASNFSPKEFWYNGQSVETPTFNQLMDIVKTRQIRTVLPTGLREAREVSGVKVELLHPFTDKYQGVSPDSHMLNNNSLVIKMSYGDRSLLFPGDLETEGERDIVSNVGNSLNSDILLASHHGSKYSCTLPFLSMVTPEICVISAGKDNYFGFPHENTLERLKKTGCRVMRIDEMGAVKISVNKDELKINSYFN